MEQRFKIGTVFTRTKGDAERVLTVVDTLTTFNSRNEIVKLRYVCTYEYMGQTMHDYDVTDTEIARATAVNGQACPNNL